MLKKVVFCIPTIDKPFPCLLSSLEAAVPIVEAEGYESFMVVEAGCPYISNARATLLRKALDAKADIIIFLDHDISFPPESLVKLIKTEGDYVCGTYRFKKPEIEYMGQLLPDETGKPIVREDGALLAYTAPAGFVKITPNAINILITKFPELCYGNKYAPYYDFFNHGAHNGTWWGEDYAACRRWNEAGQQLYIIPDITINHHTKDECFTGNYHEFLLTQPGGSNDIHNGS